LARLHAAFKSDWGTAATFEENQALLADRIALYQLLEQHAGEKKFMLVPTRMPC
jgi:hypothetical protein